jgi:hypothetical protein
MSIQSDVDRGLQIKVDIEALEKELKVIEKRLAAAGLKGEQIPLEDPTREGRQWIAKGSGACVPVLFSADSIISGFADESAIHMQLRDLLGTKIDEFFKRAWVNRFRDGQAFRAHAREVLADRAPSLITACLSRDKEGIPKNKTVIAWSEARLAVAERQRREAP